MTELGRVLVTDEDGPVSTFPLRSLRVVAVADLVLHEAVEARRAAAVVAGMGLSGVLTDPVVAAPAPDGRWLVLDGAHRTTALGTLGIGFAVVQRMELDGLEPVVETAAPTVGGVSETTDGDGGRGGMRAAAPSTGQGGVPRSTVAQPPAARVDSWSHDIRDAHPTVVAAVLAAGRGDAQAGSAVVATVSVAGTEVAVRSGPALADRLEAMWALADCYAGAEYVRTQHADPAPPGTTVRVSWAPIQVTDLLHLAELGAELPAGVSRFVLPGRLLGLRVPLADLRAAGAAGVVDPVAVRALLRRLDDLPVRHYREPVWVVESSTVAGIDEAGPAESAGPAGSAEWAGPAASAESAGPAGSVAAPGSTSAAPVAAVIPSAEAIPSRP